LNTGPGTDTGNVPSLRKFAATVRGLDLPKNVLVGGGAFVFSDVIEAMLRDGPRATALSAIGALLIVALAVGWGRYAFVTAVCGALGTLSLLAVAHALGIKVNFLDFVALPITIGIGIDYAVNIASRARQAGASGRTAVETTGGAVLLCSYTTVVGYASLLFSANKGIRSFGESAMIGELTCITTALVFAPALVDAIARVLPMKPRA
jgi:predicted RND superfamily exporter protein